MAAGFANAANTFVPSFDASGKLTVAYSRNPKSFAVNQYTTITKVNKSLGWFLKITPENAGRILTTNLAEFAWHDGQPANEGVWNTESFEFVEFATQRYQFPFRFGYKAVEQADWQVLAYHASMAAQQAMTARSLLATTAIMTSGNYASGHTDTATNLGGGKWTAGTGADPNIKQSIMSALATVHKATLGVVKPDDFVLVIGPDLAHRMATSEEVHAFVKESPYSKDQVEGRLWNPNIAWGLPERLYGIKVVVEDAVRVSSIKGHATLSKDHVVAASTDSAALIARPGGLTNTGEGASAFSFLHCFEYEGMTVESKDDPDNRLHRGRVVEDYVYKIVSNISGYLITDCV